MSEKSRQALIDLVLKWKSDQEASLLISNSGEIYFWAFGAIFERKGCNACLCDSEKRILMNRLSSGELEFENPELEREKLSILCN